MRLATALIASLQRVPTQPGVPYGGGFYVGRLKVAGQSYALIVAPKATGETKLAWKNASTTTLNTDSAWDGAANTAAMIADSASHPAAQFCKGLSIGGFTDWFLPARDQLELCYRNLKPGSSSNDTSSGYNQNSDPVGAPYTASSPSQTTVAPFRFEFDQQATGPEAFGVVSSSVYWSSTHLSAAAAYSTDFSNGLQAGSTKITVLAVRAVRMIKI